MAWGVDGGRGVPRSREKRDSKARSKEKGGFLRKKNLIERLSRQQDLR